MHKLDVYIKRVILACGVKSALTTSKSSIGDFDFFFLGWDKYENTSKEERHDILEKVYAKIALMLGFEKISGTDKIHDLAQKLYDREVVIPAQHAIMKEIILKHLDLSDIDENTEMDHSISEIVGSDKWML